MAPASHRSPLTAMQLVDEYFLENRNRLLEIAAFLDRLDRTDPACATADFRMKAFAEGLDALSGGGDRLTRIQHILSDPTTGPLETLDRKGALGAYDRWNKEARS
jgi:hypothetical protein